MSQAREAETLTPSAYAVLGLLALRPWSTYELARQMDRAVRRFWPRAERMVYIDPKLLVTRGLARVERGRTGKRPRHVYSITPKGRRELERWLAQPPTRPLQLEFEAMLKVYFAEHGTKEALLANLRAIEEDAVQSLASLSLLAREATESPDDPFANRAHIRALTLAFYIEHARFIRDWAERARREVARWESSSISPATHARAVALLRRIAEEEALIDDA